jgi:hypothetical protein
VLKTCQKAGLKFNPSKCDFFKKSVKRCGRAIDAKGVAHDPDRIRTLIEMPDPVKAQDEKAQDEILGAGGSSG